MNRRERRAQKSRAGGPVASGPPLFLDVNCAGPFSDPPTACTHTARVKLPLDIESLRRELYPLGWLVTVINEPGEGYIATTTLCGDCAKVLVDPALLARAREEMAKKWN